jgi:hypothetical protein
MATTPEEEAGSSSTTDAVTHSPTRPPEFDLTEASTGRVWRQRPFATMSVRVSSSQRLMGDYVNGKAAKILGWLTVAIMAVAAVAMFATGGISF